MVFNFFGKNVCLNLTTKVLSDFPKTKR